MKQWKKILATFLAGMLVFCMTSCAQEQENSGDWVAAEATYTGALCDTGYYYLTKENILHYVDFYAGTNVCLCSRIGCKHDDYRECDAYIADQGVGGTTLRFWNGGIYYVESDQYGPQLYRRNATGGDLQKIACLGETYLEMYQDISLAVYAPALAEGFLYYYIDGTRVLREEEGMVVQSFLKAILRLDLSTGKETVVVEERRENYQLSLIAAKKNSAMYSLVAYPEDSQAEDYSERSAQCPVQVLQWNAGADEDRTLLEGTKAQFGEAHHYYDGKLYYALEDGRYSYDLKSGKTTQVAKGATQQINEDYAIQTEEGTGNKLLLNMNTGALLPNALSSLRVRAVSKDMVILIHSDRQNHANRYGFVALDSLSDGLQEEDFFVFYALPTDG